MTKLTMTIECAPGTLTAERALAIGQAWAAMLNAQASAMDPTVGDIFTYKELRWIDDGKDTLTVSAVVAPSTGGGAGQKGQGK